MFQYVLYAIIAVVFIVATALCLSAKFGKDRTLHTLKIVVGCCLYFLALILLVASFLT
ncbi:hypothetical protein OZX72_04425 [Bifidobacterium sp. ESL0769]|uniref:hypothetical protein n=1 Tax=Bifidobacterium sp. ESL0769 TaxID=2983229 RepID=UPI0023F91E16|nr:hypothetical protein [Bifidobacterium sp. ESL0769]WEV68230.1 hypothetical protein OZX72_04425 [Bifidobacterium sp. ESL0769]